MKCRTLDQWHGTLTGRRRPSQFSSTWTSTRQLLERELSQLGARNAVLELTADQTDMRNDGWQDNVRAIALALEALRKVDRYGVTDRGEQYAGWAQIEQTGSGTSPLDDLAFLAGLTHAQANEMTADELVRQAKKRTHPDAGGHAVDFHRVMELAESMDRSTS